MPSSPRFSFPPPSPPPPPVHVAPYLSHHSPPTNNTNNKVFDSNELEAELLRLRGGGKEGGAEEAKDGEGGDEKERRASERAGLLVKVKELEGKYGARTIELREFARGHTGHKAQMQK